MGGGKFGFHNLTARQAEPTPFFIAAYASPREKYIEERHHSPVILKNLGRI
jgi:hypothetical protein